MPRIGQGAILYHRKWGIHPFLTLADNIRTGSDFGHFHLGHRLGLPIFGLHGSYIVVKNAVEQQIGFDFGPQGSITEDAFWGLVAVQKADTGSAGSTAIWRSNPRRRYWTLCGNVDAGSRV